MEEKIVYFETPGEDNTEAVLALVKERAEARNIKRIGVDSTRGIRHGRQLMPLTART